MSVIFLRMRSKCSQKPEKSSDRRVLKIESAGHQTRRLVEILLWIHLFVFFDPSQHIFLTHAAIGYAKPQCYDIFIA